MQYIHDYDPRRKPNKVIVSQDPSPKRESLASYLQKPLYVVPGKYPGLVQPGNINVLDRPPVKNPNGGYSSVLSFSIGTPKGEVLIPQVVNGQIVSKQAAMQHYFRTRQHLGVFADSASADRYAQALHLQQERMSRG